jgi:hypothetical protein
MVFQIQNYGTWVLQRIAARHFNAKDFGDPGIRRPRTTWQAL